MAEQNVIHRDLKVANVFMHNGRAKIADFGFAKFTKYFLTKSEPNLRTSTLALPFTCRLKALSKTFTALRLTFGPLEF